ncbi:MAG: hypothetical protein ACOC4G_11875 [Bacillota bacterium]
MKTMDWLKNKKIIDLNINLTTITQTLGQNTSSGVAANIIHNGMTAIAELHEFLQGLKICYGIII